MQSPPSRSPRAAVRQRVCQQPRWEKEECIKKPVSAYLRVIMSRLAVPSDYILVRNTIREIRT